MESRRFGRNQRCVVRSWEHPVHTPGTGLDCVQERQGGLVLGVGGGMKKMFKLCCLLMGRSLSLERDRNRRRKPAAV